MPDKEAPYSWSKEELKNIDPEPIFFEGQEFDSYQTTQQQRKIERSIRKSKRELIALDSAINAASETIKEELKKEFVKKSALLKRQNELYKKFSEAAGLKLQKERTQEYGFNRSMAAKVNAVKKQKDKLTN